MLHGGWYFCVYVKHTRHNGHAIITPLGLAELYAVVFQSSYLSTTLCPGLTSWSLWVSSRKGDWFSYGKTCKTIGFLYPDAWVSHWSVCYTTCHCIHCGIELDTQCDLNVTCLCCQTTSDRQMPYAGSNCHRPKATMPTHVKQYGDPCLWRRLLSNFGIISL